LPAEDPVLRAQSIQRQRWGTDIADIMDSADEHPQPGTLDEFLWRARTRGFSLTGMAFMDRDTLTLERLRRCYLFIVDPQGNPIPFCAYNLTDARGRPLYRGSHATG
jgi:uncharacterized radical SAM superfamily Fe-S cluster-containing enzyme